MKPICLAGDTFGRLFVLTQAPHYNGRVSWLCLCDCGKTKTTDSKSLRTGSVASCGCARATHGQSKTPLYKIWIGIRSRCNNPHDEDYKYYGARGIKVCKRWADFPTFAADMGERPTGLTIERRNNDGDYEPSNCYWATVTEQHRNTRYNRYLTAGGQTRLLTDWARDLGVGSTTITNRLKYGWSEERACLTPVRR